MRKKLTRIGGEVALVLDAPLLEQFGLNESSEVELSTNGDVLIVTPIPDDAHPRKLNEILDELDEQYAGVFRRLAE